MSVGPSPLWSFAVGSYVSLARGPTGGTASTFVVRRVPASAVYRTTLLRPVLVQVTLDPPVANPEHEIRLESVIAQR